MTNPKSAEDRAREIVISYFASDTDGMYGRSDLALVLLGIREGHLMAADTCRNMPELAQGGDGGLYYNTPSDCVKRIEEAAQKIEVK